MIGVWLVYLLAVPATLLGGLLVSKRGRRYLKRVRRRLFDRGVKATKSATKARKDAKLRTARGQLKEQRKKEPYRLGFGHRRKEGDETRTRKAVGTASTKARGIWYQWKVSRANRKAQWVPENSTGSTARTVPQYQGVGTNTNTSTSTSSTASSTANSTLCGAKTKSGTACRNPVLKGKKCYAHQGVVR